MVNRMGGNYWVSDEEEGDNFDFERKIVDAIGKKKIACIFDFVKLILEMFIDGYK